MRELAGVILHWVSLVLGAMAVLLIAVQIWFFATNYSQHACINAMPLVFALAASLLGLILGKVGDFLFSGTTRVGTIGKWLNVAVLLPAACFFLYVYC